MINSDGQLGTSSCFSFGPAAVESTRRVKEAVADIGTTSERLLQLRPVTYRYIKPAADGSRRLQFGLIAEEVAEVLPELVEYDKQGRPAAVHYHALPALLLNQLQRQQSEVETLKAAIDTLRAELRALKAPAHAAETGAPARR